MIMKAIEGRKKHSGNAFMQEAEEEQVWRAQKYTAGNNSLTVKPLRKTDGSLATSWEEKAQLTNEVGCPKPLHRMQQTAKPSGRITFKTIGTDKVGVASFGQSVRKAP